LSAQSKKPVYDHRSRLGKFCLFNVAVGSMIRSEI
jgi:hypothetical protein